MTRSVVAFERPAATERNKTPLFFGGMVKGAVSFAASVDFGKVRVAARSKPMMHSSSSAEDYRMIAFLLRYVEHEGFRRRCDARGKEREAALLMSLKKA